MMEIFHKVELINGIERTIIYVRYPDEFEFGIDFNTFKKNVKTVSNKIKEYIIKNIKNIKDDTALLVLNGIVIGTLTLSSPNYAQTSIPESNKNTTIEANISNLDFYTPDSKFVISPKSIDIPPEQEEQIQTPTQDSQTSSKKNTTVTSKKNATNTKSTPTNTNTSTIPSSKNVKVKLSSGNVVTLSIEDYVIGIVGSEMPAEFNSEALKAQAVAARTFALKKSANGAMLTASTSDQVYKTNDELKAMWGNSFSKYCTKVVNAVSSTKGFVPGLAVIFSYKGLDPPSSFR